MVLPKVEEILIITEGGELIASITEDSITEDSIIEIDGYRVVLQPSTD